MIGRRISIQYLLENMRAESLPERFRLALCSHVFLQIAASNRHRAFSFDRAMKFKHHHCSLRQVPVAVPEL